MHSFIRPVLSQCDPPLVVRDLLAEVQDGRVLMALLEQLSGCKLVRFMPRYGIKKDTVILSENKSLQFELYVCLSKLKSQRDKDIFPPRHTHHLLREWPTVVLRLGFVC